jgi:hypothetical protein
MLLRQSWYGKKESEKESRSHAGILEQISERNKRLLDIAPISADSHVCNDWD